MKLTDDVLAEYKKTYEDQYKVYEKVSIDILRKCRGYIQQKHKPNEVRAVFSREPIVKEWGSLIKKIDGKRAKDKPNYQYCDLDDLIALTVLCPFKSDAAKFIKWMKNTFDVRTSDKEALRDVPTGHRGYHYTVCVSDDLVRSFPEYAELKCEIQIKTILEEAFDAKTHDLTYKSGELLVSDDLKHQFGMLSSVLGVIDKQSEFLKTLLLEDEKEKRLRREACALLYLEDKETIEQLKAINLDPDHIEECDVKDIADKLRSAESGEISKQLCKSAALCALKKDDGYLSSMALRYCEHLESTSDGRIFLTTTEVRWALGKFESAMSASEKGIAWASENGDETTLHRAKNCFVYWFTDWCALQKNHELQNRWRDQADQYAKEVLEGSDVPARKDTLGFYKIVFGTTDEVEDGRRLIRESSKKGTDKSDESFFRYHEHFALCKLLATLEKETAEMSD